MKTIKLSCAHALFKYLIAQKTMIDGKKFLYFQEPLLFMAMEMLPA
jgi:TPP-dependent trihydroxycyclohexane-1,2-dione (THcHDO) dehydratase